MSDDPIGVKSIAVWRTVPSCKLIVTGSTYIGGVKACCIIDNSFPTMLRSGSCMNVLIQYKAAGKWPRNCELVIASDDPVTHGKCLT